MAGSLLRAAQLALLAAGSLTPRAEESGAFASVGAGIAVQVRLGE